MLRRDGEDLPARRHDVVGMVWMLHLPGCLDVGCWQEATGAVVTAGKWESKEALRAGFAAVARPRSTTTTASRGHVKA